MLPGDACIQYVVIHSVSQINWVVCKLDNLGTGDRTCLTQILFMQLNIKPSEYSVKLYCGAGKVSSVMRPTFLYCCKWHIEMQSMH